METLSKEAIEYYIREAIFDSPTKDIQKQNQIDLIERVKKKKNIIYKFKL